MLLYDVWGCHSPSVILRSVRFTLCTRETYSTGVMGFSRYWHSTCAVVKSGMINAMVQKRRHDLSEMGRSTPQMVQIRDEISHQGLSALCLRRRRTFFYDPERGKRASRRRLLRVLGSMKELTSIPIIPPSHRPLFSVLHLLEIHQPQLPRESVRGPAGMG